MGRRGRLWSGGELIYRKMMKRRRLKKIRREERNSIWWKLKMKTSHRRWNLMKLSFFFLECFGEVCENWGFLKTLILEILWREREETEKEEDHKTQSVLFLFSSKRVFFGFLFCQIMLAWLCLTYKYIELLHLITV